MKLRSSLKSITSSASSVLVMVPNFLENVQMSVSVDLVAYLYSLVILSECYTVFDECIILLIFSPGGEGRERKSKAHDPGD